MADFDDIRRGLAANLAVLDGFQISPYLLDNPTPPAISIAGLESIEYDTQGFGPAGDTHMIVVEACLPLSTDIGAQKQLDELLARTGATSLKAAIESDKRLTSRLQDDGTILTGQEAAADWAKVRRYQGQAKFTLENGTDVRLASWTVEVAA